MTWILAIAAGATVAAGVYLALSRDLLRTVIGLSLLGAAANLVVLATGRPSSSAPPIVADGETVLAASASSPIPQALVLTAIVIGFSLTCFSLVLVLAIQQRRSATDGDALREAEPPAGDDGKPIVEEGS